MYMIFYVYDTETRQPLYGPWTVRVYATNYPGVPYWERTEPTADYTNIWVPDDILLDHIEISKDGYQLWTSTTYVRDVYLTPTPPAKPPGTKALEAMLYSLPFLGFIISQADKLRRKK